MPHAPFLFMSWLTSCLPSPCRRLSRPRTTTKAPLPCRIFSVIFLRFLPLEIFHLAALRIAGWFRRSGLGNLQLDTLGKAYCDVGVGFRPFPLTAAGCHKSAKTVRDQISANAPSRTGAYKGSWVATKQSESSQSLQMVVHSKNRYRLAHLLEKGHAKRGGRRVAGRPHIAPAEQAGIEQLQSLIEKALK